MIDWKKVARYSASAVAAMLVYAMWTHVVKKTIRADDNQEIAPYKFADLPHGRIYKAVHEGCELYIVEGEMRVAGSPDQGHFYTIATARGCK